MSEKEKEKEALNYKLDVRVYGLIQHSHDSHSYLIDDMPTGVSHVLGTLQVNIRSLTFRQLRPMLEYDRSGHMDKRSLLFQEARFIMGRLPNLFDRPESDRYSYRLAFLKKDKHSELRMISPEDEDKVVADMIGAVDFFSFDLAIVPLSQIDPSTSLDPAGQQQPVESSSP